VKKDKLREGGGGRRNPTDCSYQRMGKRVQFSIAYMYKRKKSPRRGQGRGKFHNIFIEDCFVHGGREN